MSDVRAGVERGLSDRVVATPEAIVKGGRPALPVVRRPTLPTDSRQQRRHHFLDYVGAARSG